MKEVIKMKFTKFNNPSRKKSRKTKNAYNQGLYNQVCELATGDFQKDMYLVAAYNIMKH